MTHSIEVDRLTKRYGSFVALDHVSFRYEGPRAIGYLGPNGAGKTTTLKLLTRLIHPTDGRALIDGIDLADNPRAALAQVGSVVETPAPYATFTVRDTLEIAGEFRGLSRETIRDRIDYFDRVLELPKRTWKMGALSKGLRQRVVLTGALLSDPPVILLDEPTSGLDPAERVRVRNLLLELKRDHLILVSSHLLGEVTETCDEVIFLNHGKILQQGPVRAIQDGSSRRRLEVSFLEPVAPARVEGLGAPVVAVEAVSDRCYRLTYEGGEEARATLLDRLREFGRVTDFSPLGSPLEEAYLKLMGEESAATAAAPNSNPSTRIIGAA